MLARWVRLCGSSPDEGACLLCDRWRRLCEMGYRLAAQAVAAVAARHRAKVAELAYALDLGSSPLWGWGFESPLSHQRPYGRSDPNVLRSRFQARV